MLIPRTSSSLPSSYLVIGSVRRTHSRSFLLSYIGLFLKAKVRSSCILFRVFLYKSAGTDHPSVRMTLVHTPLTFSRLSFVSRIRDFNGRWSILALLLVRISDITPSGTWVLYRPFS